MNAAVMKPALTAEQEALVLAHLNLVHYVARRTPRRRSLTYEDLFQVGCLGLCSAARAFDPGRGVKFSTLATKMVRWTVGDYIKTHGCLVRTPKWWHRTKTTSETRRAARRSDQVRFLADLTPADSEGDLEVPSEDHGFAAVELEDLLGALPERYATIVRETVLGDTRLVEMSRRLGVSVQRCCQLRQKALQRLRALLVLPAA